MFGIGMWEIVVIVLVALLVVGPQRIGPLARAIGRAMREMRRGMDEFRDTFNVDEPVREIEALKSEIVREVENAEARDEHEDEVVRVAPRPEGPEQVIIDYEVDPDDRPEGETR